MIKLKQNKRGFFYTLDALLALVLTITLLTTIFFYMDSKNSNDILNSKLTNVNFDSLAVLDKTFSLSNSSQIQIFLNALPKQICSNITTLNSNSQISYSVQKQNCTIDSQNKIIISRRTFFDNNEIYYAEMRSWYK